MRKVIAVVLVLLLSAGIFGAACAEALPGAEKPRTGCRTLY